jgi:hypothetical protein
VLLLAPGALNVCVHKPEEMRGQKDKDEKKRKICENVNWEKQKERRNEVTAERKKESTTTRRHSNIEVKKETEGEFRAKTK